MINDSLLVELISFAKDHNNLNQLIEKDTKYAFALEKCLVMGYICGMSHDRNANDVPVFQVLENYSVTDRGLKFLESSSPLTDL